MTREAKMAVRQVLREAAETPNFFDLSDGEQLVRMISMGFEAGKRHRSRVDSDAKKTHLRPARQREILATIYHKN